MSVTSVAATSTARSRAGVAEHDHQHGHRHGHGGEGHIGWFEHTISGIASSVERAVFTEELARKPGWLQRVDPRVKLGMFLIVVLAASASSSLAALALIYVTILVAARASRLPFDFFVK